MVLLHICEKACKSVNPGQLHPSILNGCVELLEYWRQ